MVGFAAKAKSASQERLSLTRVFPAPPVRVFSAWAEASEFKRWFSPAEGKGKTLSYDLDIRPGGKFRIQVKNSDGGKDCLSGAYREVVSQKRLVFSMALKEDRKVSRWDSPMGETEVTVEFKDLGSKTQVTISQEPFPSEKSRDIQAKGWGGVLDSLARHLAEK